MENLIEGFQNNTAKLTSFLMKQESAPTITLFGPTKSGKSTIITELLDAASNKLLGHNVGEDAQTTLIRLVLMLNDRFSPNDVIIRCIPHKNQNTLYYTFITEAKRALIDSLYTSRDELEDYLVEEELLKNILNPRNRSYHCFDFVKENNLLENFNEIIAAIASYIINKPELLSDEANRLFKERKKAVKDIKKRDIYEEIIDSRFNTAQKHQDLQNWFFNLKEALLHQFSGKWSCITKNNDGIIDGYILSDHISKNDSGNIGQIIKCLYAKNSAYSLVFSEFNYITAPSDSFTQKYDSFLSEALDQNKGKRLKINIIDTMGLTQISSEKTYISDEMDNIFQRKTDAYLFLCATNELPTIYDECISLLKAKKDKYKNKTLIICRTKADEIIRNKMINSWRKDTGENEIKDEADYKKYLTQAFTEFKQEMIISNETTRKAEYLISDKLPIEYLCTAPDMSRDMRKVLSNNELDSSKIYRILYDIMHRIDKTYTTAFSRFWLYSKDLEHKPLSIKQNDIKRNQKFSEAASNILITCNEQQKRQYLQYVDNNIMYHWNSVYCFWNKLSRGDGHETRAAVYGSFKLYIKNMIISWLKKAISMNEILDSFHISFDYITAKPAIINDVINGFPTLFQRLIFINWYNIIDNVAKKLSYDCLLPQIDEIFIQNSYDSAFRISLQFFYQVFSKNNYWEKNLLNLFEIEFDNILQKMYIFDEI